ncbi:unnamed protein product, partial [Rotaria socialis]
CPLVLMRAQQQDHQPVEPALAITIVCLPIRQPTVQATHITGTTCSGTLTTRAISALVLALSSMTLLRHQLF